MEARITVQPLFTQTQYAEEVEIQERVLNNITLSSRAEKDDWSYGIASYGSVNITLADIERRFDEDTPTSVFAQQGKDRAIVRIYMPDAQGGSPTTLVWQGLATTKASRSAPNDGQSRILARPVNSIIRESAVVAGTVVNNQTLPTAINAVLNEANINRAIVRSAIYPFARDIQNIQIRDAAALTEDNTSAEDTLQGALRVMDGLFSYDFAQGRALLFPRGGLPTTDYPTITLNNPLNILESKTGTEQVYNEIVVKTGVEATPEIVMRSEASIAAYGLRTIDIEGEWIGNLNAARDVALYLLNRLSRPRRVIKLKLGGWDIPPSRSIIGQTIQLNAVAPTPIFGNQWGSRNWGGFAYTQERYRAVQGLFYIEELQRQLVTDTITVTLREATV